MLNSVETIKSLDQLYVECGTYTKICAWRVLLNRLPTRDNLSKRRVVLNSNLCPLCNQYTEMTQHLFLNKLLLISTLNKY